MFDDRRASATEPVRFAAFVKSLTAWYACVPPVSTVITLVAAGSAPEGFCANVESRWYAATPAADRETSAVADGFEVGRVIEPDRGALVAKMPSAMVFV